MSYAVKLPAAIFWAIPTRSSAHGSGSRAMYSARRPALTRDVIPPECAEKRHQESRPARSPM